MVKHNSSYPTPFKFFSWNLNCQQKLHDYTNLVNLTVVSNWTFEWLVFVTWQVLWCVWFRIDFPVLLVTFVVWKRVRECVGDSRYTWYKTGSPPMTAGYFCWQWTVAANTHTHTHTLSARTSSAALDTVIIVSKIKPAVIALSGCAVADVFCEREIQYNNNTALNMNSHLPCPPTNPSIETSKPWLNKRIILFKKLGNLRLM